MSRSPVTRFLLVLIAIGFVWELILGVPPFGVDNEDLRALERAGAIAPGIFGVHADLQPPTVHPVSTVYEGQYWRLATAMFLHIGTLHLLLNGWALFQLGFAFEMMFGRARMLLTFVLTGLFASACSALFTSGLAAGASGAIFGVLGALIIAIRRSPRWRHESWTRHFSRQLMGWAALNVIVGFTMPGIDNAAHLGGFVAGMVMGLVPHDAPPPPPGEMVIDTTPGDERAL